MKIKTLIVAIAAAFCALFATGCADSPTDVVKDFVSAAQEGDFTAMKECTTGDLREFFGMIEEEMNKLSDKEQEKRRKEYIKEVEDDLKDIEYVSEDIDGDKATVKIKNADGEEETIKLKKVDGKWKIVDIDHIS